MAGAHRNWHFLVPVRNSERQDGHLALPMIELDVLFQKRQSVGDMSPNSPPAIWGIRRFVKCAPNLDHPAGRFPGVIAQGARVPPEQFSSEIGGLFPMALWGRTVL